MNLPYAQQQVSSPFQLPVGATGTNALSLAKSLAKTAGRLAVQRLKEDKRVEVKGSKSDLVTEIDVRAQELIVNGIRQEFPCHAIMAEEGSDHQIDSDFLWIVDPIDGTLNYARSIGFFWVSIALAFRGKVSVGVVFDPVRREMFWAQQGKGAYLNGQHVTAGQKILLEQATVGFDLGYNEEGRRRVFVDAVRLRPEIQTFRTLGSSALGLSYISCGRLDGYLHHSLYPWDLAAASLLIEEAGGLVTDRYGQPFSLETKTVLAANPDLHRILLSVLEDDMPFVERGIRS